MKTIVLAGLCASLVAASSVQADAAGHIRKAAHKAPAATEQVRNARASATWPQQPGLSYGYSRGNAMSAPAGR